MKRTMIINELEKLKNLLENYTLNSENIIRKMNKMIHLIFGEYKYKYDAWISSYSFFINIKYSSLAGFKLTN